MLAAVVSAAAVVVWMRWRGPEIVTVTPRRAEIVQTLVTIGRVAAPAEITFAARESTKITRVGVEEGTHVGAGELDGRIVEDRTIDR